VAMAHQMGLLAASILRPLASPATPTPSALELHRSPSDDDEVIRWYRAPALGACRSTWRRRGAGTKVAAEGFERADEALATVGSAQP
jgi:hypothetical protein